MGSSRRRIVSRVAGALAIVLVLVVPSRAPATVAEQRARLPPAATCGDDAVAGVWRSHKYNPTFGDWEIFTLTIERVPGSPTELRGKIENHSWQGGPNDSEPTQCRTGFEWVVGMDGRGSVTEDLQIRFGGIGQWRLERTICRHGPGGYNLDNFSGTIDPSILEFQSVNNDGGRAVNEPTVFRRVACAGDPPPPQLSSRPPPFYPKRSGCSLF